MKNILLPILLLLSVAAEAQQVYPRPRGVRYDAVTNSSTVTGTDPTWTHTPRGRISGVVAFCIITDASTDTYTGATYGGVAMTATQTANDTATELAFTEAYFLGSSSLPQGAQTVICDSSDTTLNKYGTSVSLFADEKTTSDAGSCGVSENAANPSCTITGITRESLSVIGLFSGGVATAMSPIAGFTKRNSGTLLLGSRAVFTQNYMQAVGDNVTTVTAVTDDVAMTSVAVAQP
jgi:hypothetical protein